MLTAHRLTLITCLFVAFSLVNSTAAAPKAKTDDDKPTLVARNYFEHWLKGETCLGLHEYWDVQLFFETTFEDDFKKLTNSEKRYLQTLFTNFVTFVNSTDQMKAQLGNSKVVITDTFAKSEKTRRVRGMLITPSVKVPVFLDLIRVGDKWKVINVGNNGKGLEALVPVWKQFNSVRAEHTMVYWWEMTLVQAMQSKFPKSKFLPPKESKQNKPERENQKKK